MGSCGPDHDPTAAEQAGRALSFPLAEVPRTCRESERTSGPPMLNECVNKWLFHELLVIDLRQWGEAFAGIYVSQEKLAIDTAYYVVDEEAVNSTFQRPRTSVKKKRTWVAHKNWHDICAGMDMLMQPIKSGLVRPEIWDGLPVLQNFDTAVQFEC